MVFRDLGRQLLGAVSAAQEKVVLVAPFIKESALRRLLEQVAPSVPLVCVTRWHVEEILAGASDLEIWPALRIRPGCELKLRHDLHAKYYRIDNRVFVGSANISGRALGWSASPNLELLLEESQNNLGLLDFEAHLLSTSTLVDEEIFEFVNAEVQSLRGRVDCNSILTEEVTTADVDAEGQLVSSQGAEQLWCPQLRNPEDLFLYYAGKAEMLSSSSRDAARTDLRHFSVRSGLERAMFEANIKLQLFEKPLVRRIDSYLNRPRRFGEMSQYLRRAVSSSSPLFDADRAWQTLMRWLRYFWASRYAVSVPQHSEIMLKRSAQE